MATSYRTSSRKRRSSSGGGRLMQTSTQRSKQARSPGRTVRPAQTPMSFAPQQAPMASQMQLVGGALSGGMGSYDPSTDPAVAAAAGLSAKIRAQAQATALAKRKQAAIEYGDPSGVEGVDDATAQAARENPYSVLKNLERSYETGKGELEEGLNQANLFYSGYRGKQLADAATNYQQSRYDAGTSFRGLMGDINDQLSQALLQADELDYNALLNSRDGYYDPGGYGYADEGGGSWWEALARNPAISSRAGLGARPAGEGRISAPKRTTRKRSASYGGGGATYRSM